jgi:uncharacterized membrane protein YfcA
VLVAAFLVKQMPLDVLRWLVIVVVLYAAAIMFRASWIGLKEGKSSEATATVVL